MFLTLLSVFSSVDAIIVEIVKKTVGEKITLPYNLIALIVGLIIGTGGTFAFYIISDYVPVTTINVTYAVLMGIATSMASMVGFDKVKQLINQLTV